MDAMPPLPDAVQPQRAVPRQRTVLHPWILSGLSSVEITRRVAFCGLILAVLVIATMSAVDAVRWIGRPFSGFLVNQRVAVAVIGQYHWTGPRSGLKFPDKILAANGRVISSLRDLESVVRTTPVGDPVTYSVERAGQVLQVDVPTMRFGLGDFIAIYGVYFVAGLVYLLIGAVVFILKPDTQVSWAFLLACLFLSVYYFTSFDIVGPHRGFLLLFLLVSTFVCAAGVHLSLFFPEPRSAVCKHPYLPAVPYVLATLLFMPLAASYPGGLFVVLYKAVLVCMALALGAVLCSALLTHITASSVLARQRAKIVFFGSALALPIPALAGLGSYFGFTVVGAHILNNFSAIPVAIFPASIAYAIARHNLFDVDVYIKRAVGYGVMTTLVGLMYFSTQTVMSTVLTPVFGEYRETIYPIIFALMVVFLFNPVNRRVQQAVDQIFFRKRFDYKETISAVSSVLTSMLDLEQILRQVVDTVRKEMFVDTAGVVVLEPGSKACQTFFLEDRPTTDRASLKPVAVGYDDPLLSLVRDEKRLVTRYDLEEDLRYEDLRDSCLGQFAAMGASMVIPLVYHGEVSGVLALGHKKSGHFYGREDIDLLTTMADQAAVAIRNAMAHQEVVRYAAELEVSLRRIQLLESIKSNLAKFVPKTVQELIEESPEAPSFEKREIDCSVLFADITGYTRLSAQLELDQVNKLVERYFGAFLDEILRFGGDVNETAGDGLMVIFRKRDPRKHARAAVRTALAIQRRTREINVELASQFEPIEMKVGVNSGIAAVGATKIEGAAGTRWTYTASGPTTNIAARLAALAEGGAVVLSEETQRRLDEEFELEDLGPQSLKNVPQPIRAYRLTGQRAAQIAADVSSAGRSESGAASGLPALHPG